MFKILEWSEWVSAIEMNLRVQVKGSQDDPNDYLGYYVSIDDLIHAPKLDPENPKDFCQRFTFDGVYINHVFVKHHKEPNCYWYINSDDTTLIYKPLLS